MADKLTLGLHHLGLAVSDLEAARAFFEGALGFDTVGGDPEYPSVFVSDGHSMVTLWQANSDARPFDRHAQIGLHHAAFLVNGREGLERVYAAVSKWPGVEIEGPISAPRPGAHAAHFLFRMPGGPRIELFANPPE